MIFQRSIVDRPTVTNNNSTSKPIRWKRICIVLNKARPLRSQQNEQFKYSNFQGRIKWNTLQFIHFPSAFVQSEKKNRWYVIFPENSDPSWSILPARLQSNYKTAAASLSKGLRLKNNPLRGWGDVARAHSPRNPQSVLVVVLGGFSKWFL